MNYKQKLLKTLRFTCLLAVIVIGLVSIIGTGGSSDNGAENGTSIDLSTVTIKFSQTPIQYEEVTVSLAHEEFLGDIEWFVVEQPGLSNLYLTESDDQKSVSFTPLEPGRYKITASCIGNGTEKSSSFYVSSVFPFNESKIKGYDGLTNLNELIGIIENQFWVYSTSLSETQLRDIVKNYQNFKVIGYDSVQGLLVECDEASLTAKKAIEKLKFERGVHSVVHRVYEGDNVPRMELVIPNDGSRFDDGGDNWHLERIEAPLAWTFTTGSESVIVGVSDCSYDINHKELDGRVHSLSGWHRFRSERCKIHGNSVAGAIGALTDNKVGISGINWLSQMALGRHNYKALRSLLEEEKVVIVNNSWAIPGYIEQEFDPSNQESVSKRNKEALDLTREYRKLAENNETILFVWSSGNGIDNGDGNSDGVYGVDGRHHSPALHYNDDGILLKKENVVFVAAINEESRLVGYSNYGEGVDIAAPTNYRSLGIENSYSNFQGTSAAAPVITGVASLMYSMYPGFTGKDVKDILIQSATEHVTERYINPQHDFETLKHPIPILNAAKALEKAQKIIDSKVRVNYSIPDPFEPKARFDFTTIDLDLEIDRIVLSFESSVDGGATWQRDSVWPVNGDSVEISLGPTTSFTRVDASVYLRNPENGYETIAEKTQELYYKTLGIVTMDTESLAPIDWVEISIEKMFRTPFGDVGQISDKTGFTRDGGQIIAYLKPGDYKVRGQLAGYQEAVTLVTLPRTPMKIHIASLPMTLEGIDTAGSLHGQVVDSSGTPLSDASVRISNSAQADGVFASATTDENGIYNLYNISTIDSNGQPISSFIMEANAYGYATEVREEVIVLAGKNRRENFTLTSGDVDFDGETFTNSIGMTFNYIKPGTFMMGSPEDEPGRWNNETQHQVTLNQGYHMQTTPVTQVQWEAVMGDNPSTFPNCGDDCPVDRVSWHDVQEFITALNQQHGTTGYALPTEAQWEYAARAGSTTAFANGQITHTGRGYDQVLDSMGWYSYNSGNLPHRVAQKDPNAWGLYDMHGNVYEWVADWYGTYPTSAVTDPTGPSSGNSRVVRGGDRYSPTWNCRSGHRYSNGPDHRHISYGFRLVLLPGH